mmetsp:Transcript_4812/g.14547  ORF Transcript_4812/g.14547 Transcript_4812/m.14547 type:complete len:249 (+) Transcript_4812:462-1208(+)
MVQEPAVAEVAAVLGLEIFRVLFYLHKIVLESHRFSLAKHDARGPAVVVDAYAGYKLSNLPDHGLPVVRRDLLVIRRRRPEEVVALFHAKLAEFVALLVCRLPRLLARRALLPLPALEEIVVRARVVLEPLDGRRPARQPDTFALLVLLDLALLGLRPRWFFWVASGQSHRGLAFPGTPGWPRSSRCAGARTPTAAGARPCSFLGGASSWSRPWWGAVSRLLRPGAAPKRRAFDVIGSGHVGGHRTSS